MTQSGKCLPYQHEDPKFRTQNAGKLHVTESVYNPHHWLKVGELRGKQADP